MSEELAYLAGFFDGEGSLGHWRNGPSGRAFMLSMANTNREIVECFHQTFGGSVSEKHCNNGFNKKPMWQWRVQGEIAWQAYYRLRPFLRQKIWIGEPTS
jgi:hypothetical protein